MAYFTVIIPTRNRPQLAIESIQSVLGQDFKDYEIILSDNSTQNETQSALKAAGLIERIRYVRPARELSMPDHWEFALSHASGKFVLFLTDRSILQQGALGVIFRAINQSPQNVAAVAWGWSVFDDEKQILFQYPKAEFSENPVKLLKALNVISDFLSPQKKYPYSLPRGLNSCFRLDLGKKIQSQQGRLFKSINPDFTSAFQILAMEDQMLFIDEALFISRGLKESNGGNAYQTDASSYLKTLGAEGEIQMAPMKSPLIENIIYEDYFRVRKIVGGNLEKVPFNKAEYFRRCYSELLEKKSFGILDEVKLNSFFTDWSKALDKEDLATQNLVENQIQKSWRLRLKSKIRSVKTLKELVMKARKLKAHFRGNVYKSALHAAGHKVN